MNSANGFENTGYNQLLDLAYGPNCPDAALQVLVKNYTLDPMWAARIAQHPMASHETKMLVVDKGLHFRHPDVAEALLKALSPDNRELVGQLRAVYADNAKNLSLIGVTGGVLEQLSHPTLFSAVSDLVKPEYGLGKNPHESPTLTPESANKVVSEFCAAYRDVNSAHTIQDFCAKIFSRTDGLSDNSVNSLLNLASSRKDKLNNFVSDSSTFDGLIKQKNLSESVKVSVIKASEDYVFYNGYELSSVFSKASSHVKDAIKSLGVILNPMHQVSSKGGLFDAIRNAADLMPRDKNHNAQSVKMKM